MATKQMMKRLIWVALGFSTGCLFLGRADSKPSQSSSMGEMGINALRLHAAPYNLTGKKIAIGQVEIGRPGKFGVDKAVSQNRAMEVTRVFFRDTPAKVNTNVDGHAQNVASVMISNTKSLKGVAPDARLYSSAAGTPKRNGQSEECLAAQYVAMQNGGDVRAINFSFGESLRQDPRPDAVLDGNALLTKCVDWSSRVHDVLYVVAGNQGKGGISIPTDNFNGLNVAFTMRLQGLFAKVDFANLGDPTSAIARRTAGFESNVGVRRSIGLVAPGNNISLMNLDGRVTTASGSSFAAPHVTGTVALLQEYGDRQLKLSCRKTCKHPWTLDARRQSVMKAVLMNSAEKIKDQGDGLRLGMGRTIVDKNNQDWLASDAYRDPAIPLNIQMGTGQLHAVRAYQQFNAGQWSPTAPVAEIGWDYGSVQQNAPGQAKVSSSKRTVMYQDYVFSKPLRQGSFAAMTLVWNRLVELKDTNRNRQFDVGEDFRDRGLNNLDLYLMRAEDNDISQSVWSSISEADSVEHIFYPVPATGRYKIRVVFQQRVNEAVQPYALAWWTAPAR